MLELSGKTAIITGSNSGIGAAQAEVMAQAGCRVAVCGRNAERVNQEVEKIIAAGGEAMGMPFDVADIPAIKAFYEKVMEKWGRVDILVTTHGVFDQRRGSLEMTERDFQKFMQINVISVFNFCNLVLQQMIDRKKAASSPPPPSATCGTRPWADPGEAPAAARSIPLQNTPSLATCAT